MAPSHSNRSAGWLDSIRDLTGAARKRLRCDRLLFGIVVPQRPRIDELIACDRFPTAAIQSWLESGHRGDALLRGAMRLGAAAGTAGEANWSGSDIPASAPLACITLPEGYPDRRHWLLVATRASDPFTDADLHALSLLARQWVARFNQPRELNLCRVLIGNNDRIIHANPSGEAWLNAAQVDLKSMMSLLREVVDQRWPSFADNQLHDVVFNLGGKPVWIVIERRRALSNDAAEQWHFEMRPLERGEMLPVGLVEDDRVGQVLGYIHDRYNESPSLTAISNLVDVSPFHFHRLFSRLVGTTPKQYVLLKQIHMAKWMLRSKRMAISRIASDTGFASHGHFTSTFRRMQGQSPTEYREQSDD